LLKIEKEKSMSADKLIIPPDLQCQRTQNGKLMFDPVAVIETDNSANHSVRLIYCEREAYTQPSEPHISSVVAEDSRALNATKRFIEINKEKIDLDTDMFFSPNLAKQLVVEIKKGSPDITRFIELLSKDNRLLTPLLGDDKTLLELVCAYGSSEMIEQTIQKSQQYFSSEGSKKIKSFSDLSCIQQDKGIALFSIVSNRLNTNADLTNILKQFPAIFNWEKSDYQQALDEALKKDDNIAVEIILNLSPKLSDNDLLTRVVKARKLNSARILLNRDEFNVKENLSTRKSILDIAYHDENIEMLKILIPWSGVNPHDLLIRAMTEKKEKICEFLWSNGFITNPNYVPKDSLNKNILMLAIEHNQINTIKWLLEYPQINLEHKDSNYSTVMHYVAKACAENNSSQYEKFIIQLVKRGINIKEEDNKKIVPLAILKASNLELGNRIHFEYREKKLESHLQPLHDANDILCKKIEAQEKELKQFQATKRQNKLIKALSAGNLENALQCIQNGATWSDADEDGIFPLSAAIKSMKLEVVEYIEEKAGLSEDQLKEQWSKIDHEETRKEILRNMPKQHGSVGREQAKSLLDKLKDNSIQISGELLNLSLSNPRAKSKNNLSHSKTTPRLSNRFNTTCSGSTNYSLGGSQSAFFPATSEVSANTSSVTTTTTHSANSVYLPPHIRRQGNRQS
jgi:hypothetical protein